MVLNSSLIERFVHCNVLIEEILMLPAQYQAIYPIFWASGIALLIINGSAIIACDVIAKNEEHRKEIEQDQKSSWVFGSGFLLATAVFLYLGIVENSWHPGWIVFPLAALISTAISIGLNSKNPSK